MHFIGNFKYLSELLPQTAQPLIFFPQRKAEAAPAVHMPFSPSFD
jgi:hypothetical protein